MKSQTLILKTLEDMQTFMEDNGLFMDGELLALFDEACYKAACVEWQEKPMSVD